MRTCLVLGAGRQRKYGFLIWCGEWNRTLLCCVFLALAQVQDSVIGWLLKLTLSMIRHCKTCNLQLIIDADACPYYRLDLIIPRLKQSVSSTGMCTIWLFLCCIRSILHQSRKVLHCLHFLHFLYIFCSFLPFHNGGVVGPVAVIYIFTTFFALAAGSCNYLLTLQLWGRKANGNHQCSLDAPGSEPLHALVRRQYFRDRAWYIYLIYCKYIISKYIYCIQMFSRTPERVRKTTKDEVGRAMKHVLKAGYRQ
jgi:hypothetical protein